MLKTQTVERQGALDIGNQLRRLVVRHCVAAISVFLLISAPIGIAADDTPAPEPATGEDGAECPTGGEGRKCGDAEPGQIPRGDLPRLLGGNPINVLTGNKHQKELDFVLPGSRLTLQRTYNSKSADTNVGLGQGWQHTYAVSLLDAGDGRFEIIQSSGSRLYFAPDGVGEDGQPLMRGTLPNEGYIVKRGRYHEWHLPDGRTLRFRGSYLVRIDWADQQHLDLFYKGGRVAEVSDETGRIMQFEYHAGKSQLSGYEATRFGVAAGHLSRVTLPDGSWIEYDYDHHRNLTRARYADNTQREYHYEDTVFPNHLTGVTDRTGVRFSTWSYDDTGRAVSSEHAKAVMRLSVEYPDLQSVESGQIVTSRITNALGQQGSYTWQQVPGQSRPQLLSGEGVACSSCPPTGFAYSYDEQGRLLSRIRTGQGTSVGVGDTRYVYDQQGRVSEIWHSDEFSQEQLSERLEYEGLSLLPVRRYTPSVNPDAMHVTETRRDAQGLPLEVVEQGFKPQTDATGTVIGYSPIERSTRFTYDESRLVNVDGPREDVDDTTRFTWDAQNRMTSIVLPDSPPLRITEFDVLGRAVTFVRGHPTGRSASPISVSYNQASQITSVTQMGRTLSLRYDEEGRLSGMVNRVGREMQLDYDDAGQLVSIEYVGGQRYTQDYDEEGRVVGESLMDQYGEMLRSVRKLYDGQGRVASVTRDITVAGVVGAHSTTVDYDHDVYNRPIRATDRASAGSVEVEYNALGELAGMTGPTGTGITLGYDVAGNPSSVQDTRDNTTRFIQDDFGRVVAVVNADTGTSRYEYDAAGNRIQWINPAGDTTSYTWDAADRPLLISSRDGDTQFAYDRDTGLLAQTSNGAGTERFEYDADARLLRHERLIDGRSFVTAYQYDDQGRMTSRRLPDGQSLRYHYYDDGALVGQLRAITRSTLFGLQQEMLLAEIDEDPNDGITGYIAHNGKRTTRTHASDGRITRIEVSDTLTLDYRYDGLGRIIGIDENGIAQSFAYSKGYLSAASTLTGSYVFNYDEAGNRTGKSVKGANGQRTQSDYQYSEAGSGNHLLAENERSTQGSSAVSYNRSGSPVARGALSYEYNNDQRPVRVYKDGTLLAEYAYNSFGERIRKVTYRGDQKRVTYFLYDGHQLSAEIVADDDPSHAAMSQTIYRQGQPVIQLIDQAAYAVHSDRLGTPHLLSDEAGAIAWQAEYSPFGRANLLIDTVAFKHRLPGQYEDSETGTHYNYLRDYDPDTGRYLTSDPLSIGGGLNTYLYANADPLNSVDVLGLKPDLSGFDDQPGTYIDASDYDKLHGYAMAGNGVKYFEMLFELTGHGLYKDFADSYSQTITPAAIYILREVFMRDGMNSIKQVACLLDRSPVYHIEEMDLFSETVFQAAGIGRGVATFAVDGVTGLWNLGVGTVNLALDSTVGLYGDLLRNYFGEDSLPAWYPSYADAVDTVNSGLAIGQMIIEHPKLIWDGLTEDKVKLWAEGRYAESITQGALELGSMFVGVGALAKVSKLADLMKVLKRVDAGDPGAFNRGLDELIDEFGDDPDALRQAAERAGLSDEVNARIDARTGLCSFAGDTLVLTEDGDKPIRDILAGKDRVWAKDEHTGRMGWREVLAHYSNRYAETVHVTAVDDEGGRQTIRSNRIHPYFARLAAGAVLVSAGATMSPAMATEGHIYRGDIAAGAWVDAQHLKPGDELLGDDGQWLSVEKVTLEDQALEAWNLTVDEYATYFVAGDEDATAVWVHNTCYEPGPNGEPPSGFDTPGTPTTHGQPTYVHEDGSTLYRGHDNRYYDPVAHPPTPAPPRYTLGSNDGGPGLWSVEHLGNRDAAAYQSQVTGAPIDRAYVVKTDDMTLGELSFDGYDTATGRLIDAKRFEGWPNPDFPHSMDVVLQDARKQQDYMDRSGLDVEWRIKTQEHADIVQGLFASATPPITIIIKVVP